MLKLSRYFRETKQEMTKVVWPSKAETINYTIGVILISLSIAAFFSAADFILQQGLEQII